MRRAEDGSNGHVGASGDGPAGGRTQRARLGRRRPHHLRRSAANGLRPDDVARLDLARDLAASGRPIRTRAASIPTCIATGCGRCASSPASAPRARPTSATSSCSRKARRGSRSRSTCRPSWATTPTRRKRAARSASAASRSTRSRDMETLFAGIDMGAITTSMTINGPAAIALAQYVVGGREQGYPARGAGRHAAGRHPQGIHRAERVDLSAASARAHHRRHDEVLHGRDAAGGTRSRSPATTSAKPARPPRRSSRSRSPTASRTSRRRWPPGWTSTRSLRGSRSSSTRTSTSSRRSPSSARRAASTRATCASVTARRTRARGQLRFHTQTAGCSATAQQPENNIVRVAFEALAAVLGRHAVAAHQLDGRSARAADREVGRRSRCARSRCWRTRRTSRTSPIRSAARTSSRRSPTRWSARPKPTSRRSRSTAASIEAIEAGFFQREIAEAIVSLPAFDREQRADHRRRQRVRARRRAGRHRAAARSAARWSASRQRAVQDGARPARRARGVDAALAGAPASVPRSARQRHAAADRGVQRARTEGEIVEAMVEVYGRYVERAAF